MKAMMTVTLKFFFNFNFLPCTSLTCEKDNIGPPPPPGPPPPELHIDNNIEEYESEEDFEEEIGEGTHI
jgi:hypothetical protein